MKKMIVTGLTILTILAPNLNATETEVANLTEEQLELKDEISKSTSKINEYQQDLNTANAEIETNETEIENLNAEVESLKTELEEMMDASSSSLVVMQKLNNQNVFIKYLVEDNGENFFLKYQNLESLTSALSSDIKTLTTSIVNLQADLKEIEDINAQNVSLRSKSESILEKQEKKEAELQETLSDVDSSLLDASEQLTLEQAKKLEEQTDPKEDDKAKKEESVEPEDTEEVVEPEVVKPEVPEVVEPEVPEVVEPEVPEVVEPEVPEVVEPDSKYPSDGNVSGYKNQIMSAAGISSSDYTYVDYIVSKESSWNYLNSNPVSGAYGLCQALPGSKMSSSGSDWATNPETQMKWCNSYATSRYGSWSAAYDFWLENNWW